MHYTFTHLPLLPFPTLNVFPSLKKNHQSCLSWFKKVWLSKTSLAFVSSLDGCHGLTLLAYLMTLVPLSAVLARLWLGLRGLWLCQTSGQVKAVNHSLALAWLGLGPGFVQPVLYCISTFLSPLQSIWTPVDSSGLHSTPLHSTPVISTQNVCLKRTIYGMCLGFGLGLGLG